MNVRQRWNEILQAEGLGEIDFVARAFVPSSAAYHQSRTTNEKAHFRDAEALAKIREILAEYQVPAAHRAVLHAYLQGDSVRNIAQASGLSKDTAHRIVLRYLGNKSYKTMAEVSLITPAVPLDARRTKISKGTAAHRRPLSQSEGAAAYFELGQVFATSFRFHWERDREIWALHIQGMPRRKIARELGCPDTTVQRSVARVRRSFMHWLRTRPQDEPDDSTQIRALFDRLSNFQRE